MTVDVLAIGAHPDDVELGVGGIVRKLVERGYRVGILDLTQGELGSRGSAQVRAKEALQAAATLGVHERRNAGLRDGALRDEDESRKVVAAIIQELRPAMLLVPMSPDRHPDHDGAHALVRSANYFSGVTKYISGGEPWRAGRIYYYRAYNEVDAPDLIVDVSEQFETKLAALKAYASQFHNPDYPGTETYVASANFWESIRQRASLLGERIGAAYGEALHSNGPIGVDIPPGLTHGGKG